MSLPPTVHQAPGTSAMRGSPSKDRTRSAESASRRQPLYHHASPAHSVPEHQPMGQALAMSAMEPPVLLVDGDAHTTHLDIDTYPSYHVSIDFTKPDSLRQRAVCIEGKKAYACDFYLSIWSPIFRNKLLVEQSSKIQDILLPGKSYKEFVMFLESIYPVQLDVNGTNVEHILPLAFEFQSHGVIKKCIQYLIGARLSLLDKVLVADRYNLDDLLRHCLAQVTHPSLVDFNSAQYGALSDRTKVKLLERVHNAGSSQRSREVDSSTVLGCLDPSYFSQRTDLFYGTIKSRSGRVYFCNPHYLSAWSSVCHEQLLSVNTSDLVCTASDDELLNFMLAIHPPQMHIDDDNVAWVLRGACKLESIGMIRLCAEHVLFRAHTVSMFDKISLLDRCYLHDLLEPCLGVITDVFDLLPLVTHPTYETLSIRAKAALMDRQSFLQRNATQLKPHVCQKCHHVTTCPNIRIWLCPYCRRYNGNPPTDRKGNQPQQC